MPAKTRQITKTKAKAINNKNSIKSKNDLDKPLNVAIGGLIGLILAYILLSRALYTGSYWEYLIGLILLIFAIRLFIRSIRLK